MSTSRKVGGAQQRGRTVRTNRIDSDRNQFIEKVTVIRHDIAVAYGDDARLESAASVTNDCFENYTTKLLKKFNTINIFIHK